ncbi:MAG: hypothetical protein OMM_06691 [Candidatus Magnetoglobus multicellularis str. Araruama]|uniref:Uncharacterized protein n=1 Tax=Candidatus Magnetoglobus multicellularis str. Araruama TaxID=890399 RepID=A0A1V1PGE2_9BACT|nr:MAG: hypothetical protein OMM_06691 [Candidatus Magnetoglobus multicellularis str. Araruama]
MSQSILAETYTERTFDYRKKTLQANESLHNYIREEHQLNRQLQVVQQSLSQLQKQLHKALSKPEPDSDDQLSMLRTEIIKLKSQENHLINQRSHIIINRLKPIQKNLRRMKIKAAQWINANQNMKHKQMNKENLSKIFQNISLLTQQSTDPWMKQVVANLLSKKEHMYHQRIKGIQNYQRFVNYLDTFDAYVASIIEKSSLDLAVLKDKKNQIDMEITLMKNSLMMKPIEKMIKSMDSKIQMNNTMDTIDIFQNFKELHNNETIQSKSVQATPPKIDPINQQLQQYSEGLPFLE